MAPTYEQIRSIFVALIAKHYPKGAGDYFFYTPAEWEARKEGCLSKSLLVMTFEGGWLAQDLQQGTADEPFQKELAAELDKLGCYTEFGHSWSLGVYQDSPVQLPESPVSKRLENPAIECA